MKLRFLLFLAAVFFIFSSFIHAENSADSVTSDTKKDKVKTGWNFGGLPILGYDSDMGFQYGVLANIYYYGDGSTYPQYFHSFYFEVSRYTKGTGINQFFFDSKKLIPKVRVTADITSLPRRPLIFMVLTVMNRFIIIPGKTTKRTHRFTKPACFIVTNATCCGSGPISRGSFFIKTCYGWQDSPT